MAGSLSVDQFVAIEVWVERLAKGETAARVHAARQRAFTLLTGLDAPPPVGSEELLAFADAVVDGVDAKRRIGPKPRAAAKPVSDEEFA